MSFFPSTFLNKLRTGAFLPALWDRMMTWARIVRLPRGLVFSRAVSGILAGASQRGGLSASCSPNSSLQTGKAQSVPAPFSSLGTSWIVQANKTHLPELASPGYIFSRSFSQSVSSQQGLQSPKVGHEEGGSSMKQGTFFISACLSCKRGAPSASAISPSLPECFRRDRRRMDYDDKKILVDLLLRLVLYKKKMPCSTGICIFPSNKCHEEAISTLMLLFCF